MLISGIENSSMISLLHSIVIQIETSKMYVHHFNRIKYTIWTICPFRVLNLHQ